ncbi:MAG: HAD family hydrolase [Candidatus Omnitrophica bacterium]|nr:HAD family hydrolase [Candidatus Omnitrophota bacterium]
MTALKYDALIFDFDGVLVDSEAIKVKAFEELYAPYGRDITQKAVEYHLQNFGVSRFLKFQHCHKVFLNKELTPSEESAMGSRFSRLVEDEVARAPWMAGADAFLAGHHQLLPLHVASGTPEGELRRIISKRGMDKYFHSVYGVPAKKHEIISRILRENGYSAGRVLMIGDSMADWEGAHLAGVDFVALSPGKGLSIPQAKLLPDYEALARYLELS